MQCILFVIRNRRSLPDPGTPPHRFFYIIMPQLSQANKGIANLFFHADIRTVKRDDTVIAHDPGRNTV